MRTSTLTIVGVGLIGGSIGLAAKRRRVAERVIGVGREQADLERALKLGLIDEITCDLQRGIAQAAIVVFCTPVNLIAEQIIRTAPACGRDAVITDTGSTKAQIIHAVEERLPDGVLFVGSHPLAGSEKSGPEHADADLFQDRIVVVTPSQRTAPEATARVSEFWRKLGARIEYMAPEAHDEAMSWTSHLPHLLASALANSLPPELSRFAASGFRDTTRVASGDPRLWAPILMQNRTSLLSALEGIDRQLSRFRSGLTTSSSDLLHDLLAQAKKVRDDLAS
jgi:prephenate dehydrogenase